MVPRQQLIFPSISFFRSCYSALLSYDYLPMQINYMLFYCCHKRVVIVGTLVTHSVTSYSKLRQFFPSIKKNYRALLASSTLQSNYSKIITSCLAIFTFWVSCSCALTVHALWYVHNAHAFGWFQPSTLTINMVIYFDVAVAVAVVVVLVIIIPSNNLLMIDPMIRIKCK